MRNDNRKSYSNKSKQPRREGDNKAAIVSSDNKFAHIEAVQAQPLEVKVYNNNFDKALRAFRALVQKDRILSTYKEKQFYEKPSDKRRRKKNESKRKWQELDSLPNNREKSSKSFKSHQSQNNIDSQ
jgi:small subunit ribosomal protein S21